MPTDATVILLPKQEEYLLRIKSRRLRKQVVQRLNSLKVFPQSGAIDSTVPPDPHGAECRVTYVAPYGIRYRYDLASNTITVDSITNERYGSAKRFL